MNPDFDDFDDVPTQTDDEPRSRTMPRLVVGVAVVAFIALAWYAYRSGSNTANPDEIQFIEADNEAYKERPAEPGGEEFPHKDKTIYDAISPYAADDAPKVEKLLPEPEQPVMPKKMADAKDTYVSDEVKKSEEPPKDDKAVEAAIAASEQSAAEKAEALSKEVEKSIAEPAPAPKPAAAPPVAKVEPKPEPKPTAPKAEPVVKTSAAGIYKIQLGAYKSEAEAKQTAARIAAKNGDVLSSRPQFIVKADLPNGTYYRLRFGGYDSPEAAKAACAKLSARGQGCFYAGK